MTPNIKYQFIFFSILILMFYISTLSRNLAVVSYNDIQQTAILINKVFNEPLIISTKYSSRANKILKKNIKVKSGTMKINENTFFINPKDIDQCQTLSKKFTFPVIETKKEFNEFVNQIDSETTKRTLRYFFESLAIGIYVQIENNKIQTFMHLTNIKFENDWDIKLDVKKYKERKQKQTKRYFEKFDYNTKTWTANNCLLGSTLPHTYSERRMHHYYDMLTELLKVHKIPDCEFMMNRRDFPTVHQDGSHPYTSVVNHTEYKFDRPILPVFSICSTPEYADIAIPNEDDWEQIRAKDNKGVLLPDCRELYKKTFESVPWEKKKDIAVWRGKASGCGITLDTNQRLKLYYLSTQMPDILNAGITGWNQREKMQDGQVKYLDLESLPIEIRKRKERMEYQEQLEYKYHINVDGHVAACRLGFLLSQDCVVLHVESMKGYTLWFQHLLEPNKHYIPVKADLSNLKEQILWCRQNDDKCQQISKNATKFHEKYLQKEATLIFLHNAITKNVITNQAIAGKSNKINNEYSQYKKTRKIPVIHNLVDATSMQPKGVTSYPAIIVPYRNRAEHLFQLRIHLKKFFNENKYTLYIIEQPEGGRFNRGKLLNIGFDIALKNKHTHYIFHDVDSLPGSELLSYYMMIPPKDMLLHLASPEYYEKYSFYSFLGGVTSVSEITNKKINGYPNEFCGWGGEDDAYMNRCAKHNITIARPPQGSYILLDHDPPSNQEVNWQKKKQILNDLQQASKDGLNNLSYHYKQNKDDVYLVSSLCQEATKLALLFLTIGELKQAKCWEKFVDLSRSNVYIHAKKKENVKTFRSDIIDKQIPTTWGSLSLVKVMIELLRVSLKDTANNKFIFLSDSCIPVQSFDNVYNKLNSESLSIFNHSIDGFIGTAKDHLITTLKDSNIDEKNISKVSQWCILNRKDAQAIVDTSSQYLPSFNNVEKKNAPDELYFLTVLKQINSNYQYINQETTFTKWASSTPLGQKVKKLVEEKNNIPYDKNNIDPKNEEKYKKIRNQLNNALKELANMGWSSKHPWEYDKFTDKDIAEIKQSKALFMRKVSKDANIAHICPN